MKLFFSKRLLQQTTASKSSSLLSQLPKQSIYTDSYFKVVQDENLIPKFQYTNFETVGPVVSTNAALEELVQKIQQEKSETANKNQYKKIMSKYAFKMRESEFKNKPERIIRILQDMQVLGFQPNMEVYEAAIRGLFICGQVELGIKLIENVTQQGYELSPAFLTTIIQALRYAPENATALASQFFEQVVSQQQDQLVLLDAFANIILLYAMQGNEEAVENHWQRLKDFGLQPNLNCYLSKLYLYTVLKRGERAAEVLDQLKQEVNIKDRTISHSARLAPFNLALEACKMPEEMDTMYRIFDSITADNVDKTSATYGIIMEKLYEAKRFDMVYEILDRILTFDDTRKVKPNAFMFKTVFQCFTESELNDDVMGKVRHYHKKLVTLEIESSECSRMYDELKQKWAQIISQRRSNILSEVKEYEQLVKTTTKSKGKKK